MAGGTAVHATRHRNESTPLTTRRAVRDVGFRIDGTGKVTLDESLKGKPLASHTVFAKAADQKRFEKVAKELFGKRAVE